jgi:sugar phosphate isomerase/epimerase
VSIGTGEVDLEAIIAALRGIDYGGPLALELEVTDPENLPQYVAESHAHLKALLGEV